MASGKNYEEGKVGKELMQKCRSPGTEVRRETNSEEEARSLVWKLALLESKETCRLWRKLKWCLAMQGCRCTP